MSNIENKVKNFTPFLTLANLIALVYFFIQIGEFKSNIENHIKDLDIHQTSDIKNKVYVPRLELDHRLETMSTDLSEIKTLIISNFNK